MRVEGNFCADDGRLSAELALPEGIAEHGNCAASFLIVGWRKQAAEQRRNSKNIEEASAGQNGPGIMRLAAGRKIELVIPPGKHSGKVIPAGLDLFPQWVRQHAK